MSKLREKYVNKYVAKHIGSVEVTLLLFCLHPSGSGFYMGPNLEKQGGKNRHLGGSCLSIEKRGGGREKIPSKGPFKTVRRGGRNSYLRDL